MDEKCHYNTVDIQTKQMNELTELTCLFEEIKTDYLGTKMLIGYIAALTDYTFTYICIVSILIS